MKMKFLLFFVSFVMFLGRGRLENVLDAEMTASLKDPFTDLDSTKIMEPKVFPQVTNLDSRTLGDPAKPSSQISGSARYLPLQPYAPVVSEIIPYQAINPPSVYPAHIFTPPLSVSSNPQPTLTENEALFSSKPSGQIPNEIPSLLTSVVPTLIEEQGGNDMQVDSKKELRSEMELVSENENTPETQIENDSDLIRTNESSVNDKIPNFISGSMDEADLFQKPDHDEKIIDPLQNKRVELDNSSSGEKYQVGEIESKIEEKNLPAVEILNLRAEEKGGKDFFKDDEPLPQEVDLPRRNRFNQETNRNNEPGDDDLRYGFGQDLSQPETESNENPSSPEKESIEESVPRVNESNRGLKKEPVHGMIPLLDELNISSNPTKMESFGGSILTGDKSDQDSNLQGKEPAGETIPFLNRFDQGFSYPKMELVRERASLMNKSDRGSVPSERESVQETDQQGNEELDHLRPQPKKTLLEGNEQWKNSLNFPAVETPRLTDKDTSQANPDGLHTGPETGRRITINPRPEKLRKKEPEIKTKMDEPETTGPDAWKPEVQKPEREESSTVGTIPEAEKPETPDAGKLETEDLEKLRKKEPETNPLTEEPETTGQDAWKPEREESSTVETIPEAEEPEVDELSQPESETPNARKPEVEGPESEEPEGTTPKFWPIPMIPVSRNTSERDDENDLTSDEGSSEPEPVTGTESIESISPKATDSTEPEDDSDELEGDKPVIDEKNNEIAVSNDNSANEVDRNEIKDLPNTKSDFEETTTESKKVRTWSRHWMRGEAPEIVGIEDLPFLAISVTRLNHEKYFRCTGAIISEWYILSAAHCYYDRGEVVIPSRVTIVTAQTHSDINKKGPHTQLRIGEDVSIYPGYGPLLFDSMVKDLAVVKVRKPFEFSDYCKSISLRTSPVSSTEALPCYAPGWSLTNVENEPFAPNQLARMNLTVGLGANCPCLHWLETKRLLCPAKRSTYSICNEDVGGPLICGGKLVGVAQGLISPNCSQSIRVNDSDCGGNKLSVYIYLCPFLGWLSGYVRELRELDDFPCSDPNSAPLSSAHLLALATLFLVTFSFK